MKTSSKLTIIPLMFCFFTMGFVDLVGIASNYVKEDLNLNDATANLFPSLVFFWFLIFSVPTGMLMNCIGRKKTVLLSLVVTVVSLLLPIVGESFGVMLASFSLLGIGNALMQTSLNPLVSAVTTGKNLASTLTFGQFVKAIASFMAPYIAMWGAIGAVPSFGMGWKVLFPIYMVIGICASIFLAGTPIDEEKPQGKASGMGECLRLLGRPIVLLFASDAEYQKYLKSPIPGLPSTVVMGVDTDGQIAADLRQRMRLADTASLPLFVIGDTFNRVVFESHGYTIGMGDQLLKTIRGL